MDHEERDLVERAARTLTDVDQTPRVSQDRLPSEVPDDFRHFLAVCNGGFAKDGHVHVFGANVCQAHDIFEWNERELWKRHFGLDDRFFVFAETMFGHQFGFLLDRQPTIIKMVSPVDGSLIRCPEHFYQFAHAYILDDEDEFDEDLLLARRYFEAHGGRCPPFAHLSYKIPPILGGSQVDIENVEIVDSVTNLQFSGQIATQAKQLPPGTKIVDVEYNLERREVRLITD